MGFVTPKAYGPDPICVQLQGEGENTCVSCAAVNALRHFGLDAPIEGVVAALQIKRFGPEGGSFVVKAAKYLAREYNLRIECSRPPYHIKDPVKAAIETAIRFEPLLQRGMVGLIHRRERRKGHAIVLHSVIWRQDLPYFVTYDSNKRHARGHWIYRALDYVNFFDSDDMSLDGWLQLGLEDQQECTPRATGRVAWFVCPLRITGASRQPGR